MKQHIPVREVAAKLACCEETVRRLIRNGTLPALKMGNDYRLNEDAVALALQRRAVKGPPK